MHSITAADWRKMPWKNGGGETIELAVFPENADFTQLEWRLSIARADRDGPFSLFPGIDRSLIVLNGSGFILHMGQNAPVTLRRQDEPLVFPGDIQTDMRLVNGPVSDLNVMTRRGCWKHRMQCLTLTGPHSVTATARHTIIFCREGSLTAASTEGTFSMKSWETLILDHNDPDVSLEPSGGTELCLITLDRV